MGPYNQALRFGSEDGRGAFRLISLREGTAGGPRYEGPRHFDAHAYRSEDQEGVWDFARGCMRTYKILKARAQIFQNHRHKTLQFRFMHIEGQVIFLQLGHIKDIINDIEQTALSLMKHLNMSFPIFRFAFGKV